MALCGCLFTFLMVSFEAKILNFDEIQIILFGLLFVFGDISKNSLPGHEDLPLYFFLEFYSFYSHV